MDREAIIRQELVKKPFEARLIDEELRERVAFFKKLLNQTKKSKLKRLVITKY